MVVRRTHGAAVRQIGAVLGATAVVALIPASAAPAAGPQTLCGGWLKRAATKDEPNLLSYQFHCNWGITAYTLVVNRQPSNFDTIDDFSPTATVVSASPAPVTGVSFTCAGDIPGDGVSCNTGSATNYLPAPNYAQGQVDPSDPYCASVPPKSRPGTKPEPQAVVQLIITDTNGAQNGPFRLNLSPGCPAAKKKATASKPSKRSKKK